MITSYTVTIVPNPATAGRPQIMVVGVVYFETRNAESADKGDTMLYCESLHESHHLHLWHGDIVQLTPTRRFE